MLFAAVALLLTCASAVSARTCNCVSTAGGGTANIRSCPDTTCSILGAENVGTCYDWIKDQTGSDGYRWHNINYKGNTNGWIRSDVASGPQECGGGTTGLCAARMCSSYADNIARGCDAQGCGNYGATRSSGTHGGLDVRCDGGDTAYAPFPGTFTRRAYPYGDGSCCDTGYELSGSGAWAGFSVLVFYTEPTIALGSTVSAGSVIGRHTGLHCGCYSTTMTDHAHFQFYDGGVLIDPSSFVLC